MIRYSLKCSEDHAFESWFQSADAFSKLEAAGMVVCPECGSAKVTKSLMAPQVRPGRSKAAPTPEPASDVSAGPLTAPKNDQERALDDMRKHVETNSEYVGSDFVSEARSMHQGEAPERSIHGEARLDEAKKLLEDGVPVMPLPFMPRNKTN